MRGGKQTHRKQTQTRLILILTVIFSQISFVYAGKDTKGIAETVDKLYSGQFPEHPSLADLLAYHRVQYAIQLFNILVEQVRPVEDTEEGRKFRKSFGLRILRDIMKVCIINFEKPN